jgi:hypothetical protein
MMLTSFGNKNDQSEAGLKDPSVVYPPSEAIPDSTRLSAELLIVPGTVSNNRRLTGAGDSFS